MILHKHCLSVPIKVVVFASLLCHAHTHTLIREVGLNRFK